jgi:hypothetical protein
MMKLLIGQNTMSNLQELLVTSGFPRSGNGFVNFAFTKLFNLERPNPNTHTVILIEKREHTFVPFRNPLDCISSWHLYQNEFMQKQEFIENDLKFYLRFHNSLDKLSDKITLLDFDLFKNDLIYLSTKVTNLYGVTPSDVTLEEVKMFMNESNREMNLPRNTETEKLEIQQLIKENNLYQECVNVFQSIKEKL